MSLQSNYVKKEINHIKNVLLVVVVVVLFCYYYFDIIIIPSASSNTGRLWNICPLCNSRGVTCIRSHQQSLYWHNGEKQLGESSFLGEKIFIQHLYFTSMSCTGWWRNPLRRRPALPTRQPRMWFTSLATTRPQQSSLSLSECWPSSTAPPCWCSTWATSTYTSSPAAAPQW